jgi:D-3-phosphoglycerate dehydrogenase
MKVLANDGIAIEGQRKLEKAGISVSTATVNQNDLIKAINENQYTCLLVRSATKVRKDLIDACPGLKVIGRGGVGMDNIDVEYARSKGIAVVNTPAASSQSVAELVFAHIFSICRGLFDANRQMPINGISDFKGLKKKYSKGIEVRGKTIGIIGFGRIGQAVAKYALGCGMDVIVCDYHGAEAKITLDIFNHGPLEVKLNTSPFEEVLANSDIITLHVPAQEDGSAVIGEKELQLMKNGAILINAARGGVVNESDLLNALNSGKIAHAGLDVFENEPNPNKALLEHPKVSLSPHIGAATVEAQDRIGLELAELVIERLN